jgi:hypothetical protein
MGCERALGIAWRFEPLHPLLALARRLVGIFRAIIQISDSGAAGVPHSTTSPA